MLVIVIRKMLNNRWMILCLLVGSMLSAAISGSISMYTKGILQRMLIKDMEIFQQTSGSFPGGYTIKADFSHRFKEDTTVGIYKKLNSVINEKISRDIKLPILSERQEILVYHLMMPSDISTKTRYAKVEGVSQLQDHITLIGGQSFSNKKTGDVYEALVSEEAMKNLDLALGNIYELVYPVDRSRSIKAKVVGVFTAKDPVDPYWNNGLDRYNESILIDYELLASEIIEKDIPVITEARWYYAYDYRKLNLNNMENVLKAYNEHQRWYKRNGSFVTDELTVVPLIQQYFERERQLKILLLILQSPVLLMLAFYITMVSKLTIDYDKNEIAVLKSRGASSCQVFTLYLLESALIGLAALVSGQFMGLMLCSLLGSANGFLEFVSRSPLSVSLNLNVLLFSLGAVVLFMLAMLIPAFTSSRTSIVLFKQKESRKPLRAFWEKYFIDFLLVVIASYGLYGYKRQYEVIGISGLKGADIGVDPLLFIISTLFMLGIGLMFLRIYPYIIRLAFRLGERYWSPVLYATFIQVGRTGGQGQLLMLFLILTLSTGIFSANAARTINTNMEQKIRYEIGADIVIDPYWVQGDNTDWSDLSSDGGEGGPGGSFSESFQPVYYIEPPFEPYTQLSGVELATKVFKKFDASVQSGDSWISNVYLMGIIPHEFARVAWFRPNLMQVHWIHYLNMMTDAPGAVLISRALQEKYEIREGDTITVSWGRENYIEVVVYGIVDYWPTYNPFIRRAEVVGRQASPYFVVANLEYIHAKLDVEKYEVWLKKHQDVPSSQVYEDIINKEIDIISKKDAAEEIIKKKNDPQLQGTNGVLTLNFLITISVSIIGFLIYWIMSIKKRTLQFGIFRAMGLPLKKVIVMLACEQGLISGAAAIMGIIIGSITSKIFIPMLQLAYSVEEQVPPFEVVAYKGDYERLYAVAGILLTVGFAVLGVIISSLKMDQALKLGED